MTGGGGGGDGGGRGVMALLDEIRQQVNTACVAISILVAQSRTVTRARTRTRPGNQSDFLCYTLESKTAKVESILCTGGKEGSKGPANELYKFVNRSQSCASVLSFRSYKAEIKTKQPLIVHTEGMDE